MREQKTTGSKVILDWLAGRGRKPFPFQQEAWNAILAGESGLVNAPTGCGKTYSVFLAAIIQFIDQHPHDYQTRQKNGLRLLWITPLRALAKDIGRAMAEVIGELGMQWSVGIRNGDTDTSERQRQKRQMPEILIITPESLHLLLAQKGYEGIFPTLSIIAVDEWHELLGSKRGVQVELALSRIVHCRKKNPTLNQQIAVWGISATIGNLEEARDVLLSPTGKTGKIIRARIRKDITVESIIPDEIEKYPWAGHLGIKLVDKVIPIINNSTTTLIFINTRGMSELWYQALLTAAPELAGAIALHHGSIEQELRIWVEEALHTAKLKAVVCTASLDLGVDFRPVETVIQVGSPKGVARFLQRAGRSGHSPDATSKIYFLPTHSLELLEAAALKAAITEELIESRQPLVLCFDVLIQYLCTLAISDGFRPEELLPEVRSTHCFREMTDEEWLETLHFLTNGGKALQQYDEYQKVEVIDGIYRINSRRIAMRHRMHIGTIVSDAMLKVKFMTGGYVGVIEEWFISRLEQGDSFTLAGRNLELVMIKDMTVLVRKSQSKKSIVPSWMGGRMPLSANLGKMLREKLSEASMGTFIDRELKALSPLFQLQQQLSYVPRFDELLVEQIETKDGFHLFVFPFEGRLVHEAMAAILAYRISKLHPITFSFAMNDYGFELLSDQPIPVDDSNVYELFSPDNLFNDIQRSVNSTEMAKRKFRDIAVIGGLIFQGYPGEFKKARHLQSSASLLFKVFSDYDKENLLLRQAYQEVFDQQMEEARLRDMLHRIQKGKIILTFPEKLTPFCFPIKVDSMRENLSSEKLEDRVRKMQLQLEK
ncbi:ligase-associated DNA damage response DEXH box helicase [Flavihumibacter rivuli]|uniref:ligase-associated DNA damage response DEXH box helicase n=1 Tax=Flavihumibacter rivuli TaxID=2838156 RepID=UPI001BDEB189|nr:ligase-associated DNA damage response DEXH box helicase [Flavihumibacter rivuli]ULQ58208.1 ligase-associated DNA damage response DEXH box helicase [Flavihumibacter rivuli]